MNPADLGGPSPLTFSGPGLFYEQACLCMNRCKLPLCVKLENPKLSREECDHSFYCSLLHSGESVYMCAREKEGIVEAEVDVRRKQRAEPNGQIGLHAPNSLRNTHVLGALPVRSQRGRWLSSHQGSHDSNKQRYSCQRRQAQPVLRDHDSRALPPFQAWAQTTSFSFSAYFISQSLLFPHRRGVILQSHNFLNYSPGSVCGHTTSLKPLSGDTLLSSTLILHRELLL